MSYQPLNGKDEFAKVFNKPEQNIYTKNFRALTLKNGNEFRLGMILPKKNIKLAVHRSYIKRIIRNLSEDAFSDLKISLIVLSKKKILDFKKENLRREIKSLLHKIER